MSYILDALSKSQKERERATVPTITTEFPVSESKRRAPKALAGIGVSVLSIGVLVTAFGLSGRAPEPKSASDVTSASAPAATVPTTVEPLTTTVSERRERVEPTTLGVAAPSPILVSSRERQHEQIVSATRRKTEFRDTGKSREPEPNAPESTMIASAPEPALATSADRQLSPATQWLVKEMTALDEKARREAIHEDKSSAREASREPVPPVSANPGKTRPSPNPERAPEKADQQVLATVGLPAEPTDEVAALRDLPPETRSTIPALEVNVHTYSQTPEDRMVFINMKRYGEGDRLVEGPSIHSITPTGVVLIHEQQRFHLPAR
jgi:hypothetical protein